MIKNTNNTFILKNIELAYLLSFWIDWAFDSDFLKQDPTDKMIDIIINEYTEVECAESRLVIPRKTFVQALEYYYDNLGDYDKLKLASELE